MSTTILSKEGFKNTEYQLGAIDPGSTQQAMGFLLPGFSNLKKVEIDIPEDSRSQLFDLAMATLGSALTVGQYDQEKMNKIRLDPQSGNISVCFQDQLPIAIAAYPVHSTYVTRSTVFEPTKMNTSLNGAVNTKIVLENIHKQFEEAGAFENNALVNPVSEEDSSNLASRKLGEWFARQSA